MNQGARPSSVRRHGWRLGLAVACAAALTWWLALPGAAVPVSIGAAAGPVGPGRYQVASVDYDLGKAAFTDPNISRPLDLSAVVHYPADLGRGLHPLIIMEHGLWYSCADTQAAAVIAAASATVSPTSSPSPSATKSPPPPVSPAVEQAYAELSQWPCRPGVRPLPSDAGYDYLGENLASYGFITVSISVDAINAFDDTAAVTGDAYAARADLINEHLGLWRQLDSTGAGPLADSFTDPATGRPERVDFRGRVDLDDVGTLGHSRGGEAVMYQAADAHRDQWPTGVRIRAVFDLAPVFDGSDGADHSLTLVTRAPVAGLTGTCDGSGGDSGDYFTYASGRSTAGLYDFAVHGANHNYFNTQWSPQGGQVMASDDARPYGGTGSGQCSASSQGGIPTGSSDPQLTEAQQRAVAMTYITAFYRRYLLGDTQMDPILSGLDTPMANVTRVDVQAQPPRWPSQPPPQAPGRMIPSLEEPRGTHVPQQAGDGEWTVPPPQTGCTQGFGQLSVDMHPRTKTDWMQARVE
jgi:hypothetical protein